MPKFIAGYVADKIGRRIVFAFGTMGTALFIPVVVYMHNADNIGVLMLIFGFLYGIPYAINATYLTESLPDWCSWYSGGWCIQYWSYRCNLRSNYDWLSCDAWLIGTGLLVMGAQLFPMRFEFLPCLLKTVYTIRKRAE